MSNKRPDYSGHVVHVMNRKVERRTLFHSNDGYNEFRSLLSAAIRKFDMRILEWTLMPNHWHLLLWPEKKQQLPECMKWLTSMHARLIRGRTETVGNGAIYQSRYRSSFVKPGIHLDRIRNYIAMNPVKAGLIDQSIDWIWGSAKRANFSHLNSNIPLSSGPEPHPNNLYQLLSDPDYLDHSQRKLLSQSLHNELPYGNAAWIQDIGEEFNIPNTTKKVGRPRKRN
jgi:putative transposase